MTARAGVWSEPIGGWSQRNGSVGVVTDNAKEYENGSGNKWNSKWVKDQMGETSSATTHLHGSPSLMNGVEERNQTYRACTVDRGTYSYKWEFNANQTESIDRCIAYGTHDYTRANTIQENGDDREYNDIVTVRLKLFNTDGTAISYREVRQILQLLYEYITKSKRPPP